MITVAKLGSGYMPDYCIKYFDIGYDLQKHYEEGGYGWLSEDVFEPRSSDFDDGST
jgi:hypothetical protein